MRHWHCNFDWNRVALEWVRAGLDLRYALYKLSAHTQNPHWKALVGSLREFRGCSRCHLFCQAASSTCLDLFGPLCSQRRLDGVLTMESARRKHFLNAAQQVRRLGTKMDA